MTWPTPPTYPPNKGHSPRRSTSEQSLATLAEAERRRKEREAAAERVKAEESNRQANRG